MLYLLMVLLLLSQPQLDHSEMRLTFLIAPTKGSCCVKPLGSVSHSDAVSLL